MPVVVADGNDQQYQAVDLDSIKEFNHSHTKPLLAAKLNPKQVIFYKLFTVTVDMS